MAPLIPFNSQKISTKKRFIHWSELDRIDMSFQLIDSMISKFNMAILVCASEEFLDLFWLSDEIHDKSNGAFDPFGFGPPHWFDISRTLRDYD